MKDFSAWEMRREYRGAFRMLLGVFTVLMICCAIFGAILMKKGTSQSILLIACGVMAALALSFLGLYLVLSDPGKLLQKTTYGQALTRLGEARKIMEEIDRDALKRFERHGCFTLMNHWLILYLPNGWYFEPKRQCACPLPRRSVDAVYALPPDNPYDPQEFRICIACGKDQYVIRCYQRQDLDALRAWAGEMEETQP